VTASVRLFSYGTLQLPAVQLANYGRLLDGAPDVLAGHRLERIAIDDPEVVRLSGKAVHTIARPTGDPADRIPGTVFLLTQDELAATDAYEAKAYSRVEWALESGRKAWVYVGPARAGNTDACAAVLSRESNRNEEAQ
jgi:Gamma-glutamyl cyclotransferase, AIG2-like